MNVQETDRDGHRSTVGSIYQSHQVVRFQCLNPAAGRSKAGRGLAKRRV
jgi:hypothetical protein